MELEKSTQNYPPAILGNEPKEWYANAANEITAHPKYEEKKTQSNGQDHLTLEQYITYCHERSADNYTNQTADEMRSEFNRFWRFLND